MSIRTNPIEVVPELLNLLKKTIETSAKDINEIDKYINDLMHQCPAVTQWEKKLLDHFSELDHHHRNIEGSDFSAIHNDLTQITALLRHRQDLADTNPGEPMLQLDQCLFKIGEEKIPIFKRLRVSFDFLDRRLKNCLLCLAIFPENAILKKSLLIYWWIGKGFDWKEKDGQNIFDALLNLELVMSHRKDKCPLVSKCQILLWIRSMLISVAIKEKRLHLDEGIPRFDFMNSSRTCFIADHQNLIGESGSQIDNLRTIFNVNESHLDLQHEWVAKLKALEVLQLGRWQVSPAHHIEVQDESLLKGLRTLKFLRYLSLRGISGISTLPPSIRELVNLKILDLKACHNLEMVPDEIVYLRKLTHLDVSQCYLLDSMPKGLYNLTSLQVLKGFIIGNSQKTPTKIQHLRYLENLERLSIHIGSEADIKDHQFDRLQGIKTLKCLKMSWGVVGKDEIPEKSPSSLPLKGKLDPNQKLFELSLSFPPQLEKLDLEGFPNKEMPEWLKPSKLGKLEKLYIRGGKLSSLHHGEEEKWKVRYLLLKNTKNLHIDEPTVKEMFPSLEYVKKVKWEGQEEVVEFEWNRISLS